MPPEQPPLSGFDTNVLLLDGLSRDDFYAIDADALKRFAAFAAAASAYRSVRDFFQDFVAFY